MVPSDLRRGLVLVDLKSEVEDYYFLAKELMVIVSSAYELVEPLVVGFLAYRFFFNFFTWGDSGIATLGLLVAVSGISSSFFRYYLEVYTLSTTTMRALFCFRVSRSSLSY